MHPSIIGGKISKTPGYGHLDEYGGLLRPFSAGLSWWPIWASSHIGRTDTSFKCSLSNLYGVNATNVTNIRTANHSVLPAILTSHSSAKKNKNSLESLVDI